MPVLVLPGRREGVPGRAAVPLGPHDILLLLSHDEHGRDQERQLDLRLLHRHQARPAAAATRPVRRRLAGRVRSRQRPIHRQNPRLLRRSLQVERVGLPGPQAGRLPDARQQDARRTGGGCFAAPQDAGRAARVVLLRRQHHLGESVRAGHQGGAGGRPGHERTQHLSDQPRDQRRDRG